MFARRLAISAILALAVASPSLAAQCITSKGQFEAYKQGLAKDAQRVVQQRGMQALQAARLSSITWRFESNPSSQTGTLQSDPAAFLAKRSGSSAQAFINQARSRKAKYASLFNALERSYGVPANILVTIWGLETSWGGYTGNTPIVDGAITLASYCRRHPRFEVDAIAALQLVDRGLISSTTKGGPSGELGHMQFLAGNWIRYGVDATGDGRADPYNVSDALASAANMLRQGGWQPGKPYTDGSRNFGVLSVWNDSGNYQRAIAYAANAIGD